LQLFEERDNIVKPNLFSVQFSNQLVDVHFDGRRNSSCIDSPEE
jgi:hypothetical protein